MLPNGYAAPVIAGLAVGIGFILFIGAVTLFPVSFSMSNTASGGFPENFQVVGMTSQDLHKYPALQEGWDFLHRVEQGGIMEPLPFETNIPILRTNTMKHSLPFVEQSHPGQNFRTYYVVIEVDSDGQGTERADTKLYLVGLRYLRLF